MNRRELLRGLLAGAGVAAAGELIVPTRSIFLPPRGGWRPWDWKKDLSAWDDDAISNATYDTYARQAAVAYQPGDIVGFVANYSQTIARVTMALRSLESASSQRCAAPISTFEG